MTVLMEYLTDMMFVLAMVIGGIVAFLFFLFKKRRT
ncbi:EYxxD motif small membrane protein [Pseudalkalibacillus berkeleyi]|nr:EYxxD motif small membrane protein [Pseudalkalibacillus berkeleyi]